MEISPAFCYSLIAVIVLCIPASNAAHIDCTWDTYRDGGTGRCEPCSDLCLPARGMMEECRRRCEDFLQGKASTAQPVVDNEVEDKDEPERNLPDWAIVLLMVLVVVVISAILFAIYQCKRRNTQRADRDTSVMQPMHPSGVQVVGNDVTCCVVTSKTTV
ncbi:uncharacterized protein LOC106170145 [Lingula anatina]|uniref:Uncharacterized protein LOC106170145 n=1 Tax=Lingula anatina TaxID=7574 RepID=A0A1S3J4Y2_LINAN|nr:uncharacterized protein LOC106170145 [Lingula anatina]|eukprot:XP_013405343.1 uncharacterized protein LOC106170145 [Lingula anatina]